VALIGRTQEKLDSAVDEIRKAGGNGSAHPAMCVTTMRSLRR
jgi:hypothetical protein